jgi:hypothetical protein
MVLLWFKPFGATEKLYSSWVYAPRAAPSQGKLHLIRSRLLKSLPAPLSLRVNPSCLIASKPDAKHVTVPNGQPPRICFHQVVVLPRSSLVRSELSTLNSRNRVRTGVDRCNSPTTGSMQNINGKYLTFETFRCELCTSYKGMVSFC